MDIHGFLDAAVNSVSELLAQAAAPQTAAPVANSPAAAPAAKPVAKADEPPPVRLPDAIDAELATPARAVGCARLRDTAEYRQAVQAIQDGTVAADGLHQLLNLVNLIVGLALKAG